MRRRPAPVLSPGLSRSSPARTSDLPRRARPCSTRSGTRTRVRELPSGQTQLFIGLHLIHEVTSPQAFAMLRDMRLRGAASRSAPSRPSTTSSRPTVAAPARSRDALAEAMMTAARAQLRASTASASSIPASGQQGIVHVIGPELGLTQPGMTIACGDRHTSTHGAFGAVAFGIGTSQVRDVLATQCLALRAAEGAPHRGDRKARAGRLRQGRDPRTSSASSA